MRSLALPLTNHSNRNPFAKREDEFGSEWDFELGKLLYLQAPRSACFSRTQDPAARPVYNVVAVFQREKNWDKLQQERQSPVPNFPRERCRDCRSCEQLTHNSSTPFCLLCVNSLDSLNLLVAFPLQLSHLGSRNPACLWLILKTKFWGAVRLSWAACEDREGPGNESQSYSQSHLGKHFPPVLIINLLTLFVPSSILMFLTRPALSRSHGGFCKRLCHDHDHFIEFYSSYQAASATEEMP